MNCYCILNNIVTQLLQIVGFKFLDKVRDILFKGLQFSLTHNFNIMCEISIMGNK